MNNRDSQSFISKEVVEMTGRTRASMEQWLVDFDKATLAAINQQPSFNYELNRLNGDAQGRQFCQQPRELCTSLINFIRRHLHNYERMSPAGQSECVQVCLYQAEKYLTFMESLRLENNEQQKNLYFVLCGMMWSMLDTVDNPEGQAFAQIILRILCEHRMQKKDALAAYDQFCYFYQGQLPIVTPPMVSAVLRERFDEAKNRLKAEVSRDRYRHSFALLDLSAAAKAVVHEVHNYKLACDLQCKPFDYKLYTSILSNTQQLMVNPQDDSLKANYDYLMRQNKQGEASPKRMLAGAMLAFVGALTVAATFLAEAVSVCTSTVVSLPLKIAGFGTMFAGVTLFSLGKPYGTTSAATEFREEVDYCNSRQALSSEEQQRLDERLPLFVGMRP